MEANKDSLSQPVVILGAGGHAKVVCDALLSSKRAVRGFVDPNIKAGTIVYAGLAVLGGDEYFDNIKPDAILLANGIGLMPESELAVTLFEKYKVKGYEFTCVIHSNAFIAHDVQIGEGAQIMAGAVVQPGVRLGKNVIINTRASVDHDCVIEDFVHIAPGAVVSGNVKIGFGVHIGTGAAVIQSIQINNKAMIAAGAVVVSDVGVSEFVKGVPARKG